MNAIASVLPGAAWQRSSDLLRRPCPFFTAMIRRHLVLFVTPEGVVSIKAGEIPFGPRFYSARTRT